MIKNFTLDWRLDDHNCYVAVLPAWQMYPGRCVQGCRIWIEQRPHYCDRGRYVAKTDAPIDAQEGWPRYYFNLERAMAEIEAWVRIRDELKGSA